MDKCVLQYVFQHIHLYIIDTSVVYFIVDTQYLNVVQGVWELEATASVIQVVSIFFIIVVLVVVLNSL